ncbi:hypothetical protein A5630_06835 [Mycolicibacterium mucogenicum]|uniref:Transposase n=1 Tax=Mycolicibacterium mucogenicum TaxID=56689 RepID=A0A1A3GKJ2_MYCMU|nr:DUF6262 family protein [Mycolicibacterium mucogenicum]OBJ36562.1 hypothetical protein A5630_06835 [Mycolicibacterium mucogenicum]
MTESALTGTAAALQARRVATTAMLHRLEAALQEMKRQHAKIGVAETARRAGVSRTFLYQNPDAKRLVGHYAQETTTIRLRDEANRAKSVETSWRERALNAEDALVVATREIAQQRNTIGDLFGRIRDLEADLSEDAAQRLLAQNHGLRNQVRDLTDEVQRLNDRLHGARDNNRFLDKRIADLEAQLVDGAGAPPEAT